MNGKIYGNERLLSSMKAMLQSGRTAHSIVLYGEKGSGKKTIAAYYAKLLMCRDKKDGEPCGVCPACRTISDGVNPDVVYPQKSGKLGGFSVETVSEVAADAFIKPNNDSGVKVYVFADCDNFSEISQNKLLKLVEEPPDYAFFIFTAVSRSAFLPTILSRCVCFGTSPCSEEEAEQALAEKGYPPEEARRAVESRHGNIGECLRYLTDEELRKRIDLTKAFADSIIGRDEYALNSVIYPASRDRRDCIEALAAIELIIRDAAVLAEDPSAAAIGCCRDAAERLSRSLTVRQAVKIRERIEAAKRAIDANVSIPLALAALCSEIFEA